MKKLITLIFSVGLVTVAFAQSSDRYRNDSRSNDSYQSSPYSNNDQYSYNDQYRDEDQSYRNEQWNGREDHNQFNRRQRLARQRYEMMMMRRNQARYHHQRMYDPYYSPYRVTTRPALRISIGIGGHSRY